MGIVENMAGDVFGEGGGEQAAAELGVPFLGRVCLESSIHAGGDAGEPAVIYQPDSEQAAALRALAQKVAAQVSVMNARRPGRAEDADQTGDRRELKTIVVLSGRAGWPQVAVYLSRSPPFYSARDTHAPQPARRRSHRAQAGRDLNSPFAPAGAHAPEVKVLSPNGGETWAASSPYTITWSANGRNRDHVHATGGQCSRVSRRTTARMRTMATDGVNTSSDESDAAFTVGRKGQGVHPGAGGRSALHARHAALAARDGYDLEDGTLEAALRWRSDRDGDLGTGSQALVTLLPGRHVITLAATDKDGNIATVNINVYAGGKTYLPLVPRGQ